MGLEVTKFIKINKGLLYGICDAKIDAWHMEIRDITIFLKEGTLSFAMPAKKIKNKEGKSSYFPLIKLSEAANGKIQIALRQALEKYVSENPPEQETDF